VITLRTFNDYKAYFQAIATKHKDITAPMLFGDSDVAANEVKHWRGKKLWLEPYEPGTVIDRKSDNLLTEFPCSLFVGGCAPSGKFQDEDDWYHECEAIIRQIIAYMRKDYVQFSAHFEFGKLKFGKAEMILGSTKIIGCRLDFPYIDPTGFHYDASKWNEA
jgi:hypothetical protein